LFFKNIIFPRGGRGKTGGKKWKDLSCCDVVLKLALKKHVENALFSQLPPIYRPLLFSCFLWETNGQEHWETSMFC
jgi:hypothetical protein